MVPFGDQVVRDVRRRPVTVDVTLFLDCAFYELPVGDDGHGCVAELQREKAAILSRPFCEPVGEGSASGSSLFSARFV